MDCYLVGGACRDHLLGLPIKDKDFVVVGSTIKEMLDAGFQQVGKDFPVFIHPKTGYEYALARKEAKCGLGYTGFKVDFNPEIALEEDLYRRDLTINAIAMDLSTDQFIDPMNGIKDLESRTLRHCSDYFRDDPLRVLRTARIAAKLAHLGFDIAIETKELMKQMVNNGELNTLTPERVWKETESALMTNTPSVYFKALYLCGALELLFPEIAILYGVPQPEAHHPEIDTYIHTMMCVDLAAKRNLTGEQRFGALVHDLGKGLTPKENWPSHHGHEGAGVNLVNNICDRLKAPNDYRWMGVNASKYHLNIHTATQLNVKTLLQKLLQLGALQNTKRFVQFLEVCQVDAQGRLGLEERPYPQMQYMIGAVDALKTLDYRALQMANPNKPMVDLVYRARLLTLSMYKNGKSIEDTQG